MVSELMIRTCLIWNLNFVGIISEFMDYLSKYDLYLCQVPEDTTNIDKSKLVYPFHYCFYCSVLACLLVFNTYGVNLTGMSKFVLKCFSDKAFSFLGRALLELSLKQILNLCLNCE